MESHLKCNPQEISCKYQCERIKETQCHIHNVLWRPAFTLVFLACVMAVFIQFQAQAIQFACRTHTLPFVCAILLICLMSLKIETHSIVGWEWEWDRVRMREKNGAKERQNDTHQHEHELEHKRNCKGKHFGFDPCIVCIHFLCTSIESCEQRFTSNVPPSNVHCFWFQSCAFFPLSLCSLYTFLVFTAITRYLNDTINYFAEIDV